MAYVYGIVRAAEKPRLPGAGVEGEQLDLVTSGEVAAVVSEVPSVPVKASRRNLMAHSRVLQEVVARQCVLPMRFGVVMPSREAVATELLDAQGERLGALLDQFDGVVEVDLRALCSEGALLGAVVEEHPEIKRRRAQIQGRPPEATYYERIQLGELVARAVAAKREAVEHEIVSALAPLAAASQAAEPAHEQMLASAAFLVERARMAEFDARVEELGRELGDQIVLRYVGPLPPHNFVDLAAEQEAGSWA